MPLTIFDIDQPNERSRRELPRILPGAFRLLWAAGRRELTLAFALEAVTAVLLGVGVLLGRDVLGGILAADRSGGGWSGFLPDLAGLAAVSIALGITQALVDRQHQLLVELTGRQAQGRVLLGGADTAQADRAALRRDIAVVFQDFLCYGLRARDNIALGRHERYGQAAGAARAFAQGAEVGAAGGQGTAGAGCRRDPRGNGRARRERRSRAPRRC